MPRLVLSLMLLLSSLTVSAQTACTAGRALVSGYFSNNVHIYDACTGTYLGILDDSNRIRGTQTLWARPDGLLYVASENNGRVLRYRISTLEFVDTFIDTGAGFRPISTAFAPDGDIYIAGFDADSVRRYDGQTGALESTPIAAGAGGLNGPEIGMTFGPDGKLYIPSFYTNSVLRYDPATSAITTFIAASAGGLRNPRGLLFEPGGTTLLVSGEGSGQILRFNAATGALVGTFASVPSPAGMNYTNDGRLLVTTSSTQVIAFNAASGAQIGPLFPGTAAGGLLGATNVLAIAPKVDLSQVGTQYWMIGAGQVNGRVIDIDLASATGTQFGDAFNAANVVRKRWGHIRIEFTGCEVANFNWDSSGADSARFGIGAYPLQLLVGTGYTDTCKLMPFNEVSGSNFMNGTWYGGGTRSGEGVLITVNASGLATVAMFTHRPLLY